MTFIHIQQRTKHLCPNEKMHIVTALFFLFSSVFKGFSSQFLALIGLQTEPSSIIKRIFKFYQVNLQYFKHSHKLFHLAKYKLIQPPKIHPNNHKIIRRLKINPNNHKFIRQQQFYLTIYKFIQRLKIHPNNHKFI